jgi:hypothetical protein
LPVMRSCADKAMPYHPCTHLLEGFTLRYMLRAIRTGDVVWLQKLEYPCKGSTEPMMPLLLHGDALGEVAWLVHITAAVLGNPVGEQLQRHAAHKRLQHLGCLRDR